ncbi:hypothetical protein EZL74_11615 [Flavobacterium silvisoli]|uniref:Uncharacterized protein n=1 Tax=Flavobacterium silvisoli TaxID=2529433 RepID=A0A4Q9YQI9_9FLAO|nr:hypothetical protein EZL74_11615 [Flavobacterium silvisoli]
MAPRFTPEIIFDCALTGERVTWAGKRFSRVGNRFSRAGNRFSRAGNRVSRVGNRFSRAGNRFSRVGKRDVIAFGGYLRVFFVFALLSGDFCRWSICRACFNLFCTLFYIFRV